MASIRLVTADGTPISYHDTEAVSRDPQDRLVLADTGQNVDPQRLAHLYRTSVAVTASAAFSESDAVADVIPIEYFASPSSSTPLVVNVETVFVDTAGDTWFVARSSGFANVYVAGAADLEEATATGVPARAVAVTRTGVKGPFTDASLSPSGDLLLLKTTKAVYAYDLVGVRTRSGIAGAIARSVSSTGPCVLAAYPRNSNPGRGEAVVVADDGTFFTLAEGAKDPARTKRTPPSTSSADPTDQREPGGSELARLRNPLCRRLTGPRRSPPALSAERWRTGRTRSATIVPTDPRRTPCPPVARHPRLPSSRRHHSHSPRCSCLLVRLSPTLRAGARIAWARRPGA